MSVDYNIKVDGMPQTYGEGATRNSKEGKGRYDLIPTEPMNSIIMAYNDTTFLREINSLKSSDQMIMLLYDYAMKRQFAHTIILLALAHDLHGIGSKYYYADEIGESISAMMEDLSHHFEKGAKIYGEHNCEKGIPLKSFVDSGMRHMTQFINFTGDRDENHWIAAIWNFWMAEWTVYKQNLSFTMNSDIGSYQDMMSQIFNAPVTVEETTKTEDTVDAADKTSNEPSVVATLDDIFEKSAKFWKPGVEDESDKTPKAATVDEIFKN